MLAPDGADGGNLPAAGGEGVGAPSGTEDSSASIATNPGVNTEGSRESNDSFTVKIDGIEKKVTRDELITRYQKEAAAEKRFQEASEKEKAADKYVKAIKNLDGLIQSKNVEGIKKLLGEELFSEITKSTNKDTKSKETEYSPEDLFIANKYGVDVDELVASKREALGIDKPVVGELKTKYDTQAQEIAALKKELDDLKTESKTVNIETKFNKVKDKYPNFSKRDIRDVIDLIEENKFTADDFDKAFEMQKQAKEKQEAEWEKTYLDRKKKQADGLLTSSQSGNITIKTEEFNGLDGKSKLEKLKKMYA